MTYTGAARPAEDTQLLIVKLTAVSAPITHITQTMTNMVNDHHSVITRGSSFDTCKQLQYQQQSNSRQTTADVNLSGKIVPIGIPAA